MRQNPPSSDFAGNSLSNWINFRGAGHDDPPRETMPQEVGDFGLRGSVSAGFTGMI